MNKDKQIEQIQGDIKVIINDTIYFISNEEDRKYIEEILCDAGYRKTSEVAREIFEEIESISSDFPIYGNINTVILSERDLAFIKKKYTEVGK